jgi:hypothetical protein
LDPRYRQRLGPTQQHKLSGSQMGFYRAVGVGPG